ncbi:hypothetical protein CH295_06395 [Rhodococcus sp. 14-2483-1-2]|nr:hypothetical protein CH295_06395 [Rhodococcus sp. 14-2483-1-2]
MLRQTTKSVRCALSRVQDIAARVGATALQLQADSPGSRDVLMLGVDKVQFGFGTFEAGVISVRNGCHLTLSDQDRYSKWRLRAAVVRRCAADRPGVVSR